MGIKRTKESLNSCFSSFFFTYFPHLNFSGIYFCVLSCCGHNKKEDGTQEEEGGQARVLVLRPFL
jgi:hypothetical protein